jgi:mono/diheme cytochrome c family protein
VVSQAQDFGDVRQGRRVALDFCASCHAVRASEILSPTLLHLASAPHARDDRRSGSRPTPITACRTSSYQGSKFAMCRLMF